MDWRRFPRVPFIIICVAILAAALAVYWRPQRQDGTPPNPAPQTSMEPDGTFVYWPKNFQLTIPPDWRGARADEIAPPKELVGLQFAFAHRNLPCTFAFFRTASSVFQTYVQTSFAERVFTAAENDQLDASWYILRASAPPGFEFRWQGRQPLPGEVRINPYPVFYNDADKNAINLFALSASDGAPVPDECDHDASAMLRSLKSRFEPIEITPSSNGVAYFERQYNHPVRLIFVPDGSPVAKLVTEPPRALREPTVVGEELYLMDGKAIYLLDIRSRQASPLTEPASAGETVSSYYVIGDRIYYLAVRDPMCLDGTACTATLYEFDRKTGRSAVFAENLPYGQILGYDPAENDLYLVRGYGDAGCFWAGVNSYDLVSRQAAGAEQKFSGCAEDEETRPAVVAYDALVGRVTSRSATYDFLLIRDGKIAMPSAPIPSPGGRDAVKYMR